MIGIVYHTKASEVFSHIYILDLWHCELHWLLRMSFFLLLDELVKVNFLRRVFFQFLSYALFLVQHLHSPLHISVFKIVVKVVISNLFRGLNSIKIPLLVIEMVKEFSLSVYLPINLVIDIINHFIVLLPCINIWLLLH